MRKKSVLLNFPSRGFTLLELVVVFSVIAVVSTIGVASFVSYSRSQTLQQATNDFVTVLNTAKARSGSQIKPSPQCISSSVLNGYSVTINIVAKTYTLNVVCSDTTFPLKTTTLPTGVSFNSSPDPLSGYTFCANEDETCSFAGTKNVAYGASGRYVYLDLTDGTPCTNAVFGDPLIGVAKACYTNDGAPPDTSATTTTSVVFSILTGAVIGAGNISLTGQNSNSSCVSINATGTIQQTCSGPIPTPDPLAGYTFCANEWETCSFAGTKNVAYGADGTYVYLDLTDGTPCTNAVFGDPLFGVAKACYTK